MNKEGQAFPCGQCYDCKSRRISGWSFRLTQEAKNSKTAIFVTLTYKPEAVKMTANGFMTLDKTDPQKFFKKLRKCHKNIKLKYYLAGEYGGETHRPHYHAIIFNTDKQSIEKCWDLGEIHTGEVNEITVGYTLKYISKQKTVGKYDRDDREKEFSLMSKGMGLNYLTKDIKRWHKKDLVNRYYLPLKDGKKIAMPRYYKEKLYTSYQREKIGLMLAEKEKERIAKLTHKEKVAELQKMVTTSLYKETIKNNDKRNRKI